MAFVKKLKTENKRGFTLAEVLITITIIGIIAMQTIPTLIQTSRNTATVAQLRKAQSVFQQAYISFTSDGTTMDDVFAGTDEHEAALNILATKLKVVKNCGTGAGCFPNVNYTLLNGDPDLNFDADPDMAKAILADGTSITTLDFTDDCSANLGVPPENPLYNTCGYIYVDINGFKSPNQSGRDLFGFYATRKGFFPIGSNNDGFDDCDTANGGFGCAGKVLTAGAVNY